jgi:hypothetical protein
MIIGGSGEIREPFMDAARRCLRNGAARAKMKGEQAAVV